MGNRRIIVSCVGALLAAGGVAPVLPTAASAAVWTQAGVREAVACGATTEQHLPADEPFRSWLLDPAVLAADQGDRVERREVVEAALRTVKLADLFPPIPFREGDAEIPADYLDRLRAVLDSMRHRANVRLHFVGHTDSLPLRPALEARYGDNVGLSRERAGAAAEYCQNELGLPPEAISFEGLGDSQPRADNTTEEGRARNRRVEVEVWYDEMGETVVEREEIIPREINRIKVCRTETVCKLRYVEGHSRRAQVKNLLAPLHYEEGLVRVPDRFLQQIDQSLANLRGNRNVAVKIIAYTDDTPLTGRDERIYGTPLGLSKAVARRVAVAVQEGLALPDTAVLSEGRGATRPVASNDTPQGRMLNRRVEVEFWHDDPLQELPDEPQLCPEDAGTEVVTRVYHSPSGGVEAILFRDGQPVIPPGTAETLRRLLDEVRDKSNVRPRFIGYASNERLDRRTASVYGDDIGWSTARAGRAMAAVREQMGLTAWDAEFEGHGYVQSQDVVNSGFVTSDTSRVEVQVVYDERVPRDDYEGVEITRLQREVHTSNPFGLNLMRISVDGRPVDDPRKSIPDVQRCTDVALDRAQVQFKADGLRREPRLNVTAWPRTIAYRDDESTEFPEDLVYFRLYTNYPSYIARAEVRLFAEEQSERDEPLAVVEMDAAGLAHWRPELESISATGRSLRYLVRVYDEQGRYDETAAQPLWVVARVDPGGAQADVDRELLAGYGESRLARRNIPLRGGTIVAQGGSVPAGHSVWLAGYPVPVDSEGRFAAETILPEGLHTVELAVLDRAGNGELFLRDLALRGDDWFTVGIADLTLGLNRTKGPADLLNPDDRRYRDDVDERGRLAFYTKGQFRSGWELTASADTREDELGEIFRNPLDKSPEALFRRMDPDYGQPTFGDDSTVEEDAPTLGKFHVKVKKDDTHGLWGNFKIGYTDNDLAHVDRGLYGANVHHGSTAVTGFGEQRLMLDGFAADPGTVAARDEFRGTGGSLYYLRRRDLLEGSERVRVEIRDKDSGIVLQVKNLSPGLDYDIDYLQGRLLLAQPLSPSADDALLVQSDASGGHPAYLVVRYEYAPGFEEPDTLVTGGRAHYWLNDHVKVGVTGSRDEEDGERSDLAAADITLRKSAGSWLKLETGRSKGPGLVEETSVDGGFRFAPGTADAGPTSASRAHRADGSLAFEDVLSGGRGRVTSYVQQREAGYGAPGQVTSADTLQYGGTMEVPVSDRVSLQAKADKLDQERGLQTDTGELGVVYQATDHWSVGSGVRHDRRRDHSPEVPLTQEQGERTDALVKLLYDSRDRWTAYGFLQGSLATTGTREENNRAGSGGSYQVTDRFRLNGEASGGDLGAAGQLGTEYLYSDRTTIYLNYALANERSDNGLRARKGSLVSGFRTRYSDSASVYLEERYTHGEVPTGLMHSTGVDLSPGDRLNLGANVDFGTLKDRQTGAETKRTAAGVSAGYGFDRLKVASAVEYRKDESELTDASVIERTTWLLRNNLGLQLSPDWRLIGKFHFAYSTSSQGEFYDGEYTEAVLGSAYRPVHNDRLNALLKYTYFSNVPVADQISGTSTASGFIQRSHIGAIDVTYDLIRALTVGGKYAYRMGEVSQDRVNREFFRSDAHLYILRTDWHILHRWDALVEGRMLDLPDAEDRLSGVLVGLYRHLGNHAKLGVGYNFSKFSDDLTDLDYDHQGLFVNFVGKL
ncbi:MAG: OmpA family protein [Deferrisomatales bacterium]|nr:OmpA family protein [Deferrisomatales bacterium]